MYASFMFFTWWLQASGSMPIRSLFGKIACCRCNRPAADVLLEPSQASTLSDASSPLGTSSSQDTLTLGRVEREVLWVVPTPSGCLFVHEGL